MRKQFALTVFLLFIFTLKINGQTKWIEDSQMNFKIQIPSNYQINQFNEGNDKIHAFLSPDNNVAVRIRSFSVNNSVSLDNVINSFSNNILIGASQVINQKHTLNGLDGGLAAYRWIYNNLNVIIGVFYTIQQGNAYIIWSMIPENLFASRSSESDAITNTFSLMAKQIQDGQRLITDNTIDNLPNKQTPPTTKSVPLEPDTYPLKITSIILGSQLNPLTASTQHGSDFVDPFQPTIHLVANHNGEDNGKNFIIKWYSITHNCLVAESNYEPKINGLSIIHSSVENRSGKWPTGNYRTEIWHMGRKLAEKYFSIGQRQIAQYNQPQEPPASKTTKPTTNIPPKVTSSSSSTKEPSGIRKIVLDNKTYGYDFATGKLRTDFKPEPDVMNRPWCTPLPALNGNWAKTGKSKMEDVTQAPTSGYLSDGKNFTDCAQAPLNEVLVFKLKNGKFAKLMIISDQHTNTSNSCEHKITCLVQYPAF